MNRFGWAAALIVGGLLAWRFWRPLRPAEAEGDSAFDDR